MLEFLGLPGVGRLLEADLERALLDNLQAFLLELGRGFRFRREAIQNQYGVQGLLRRFGVLQLPAQVLRTFLTSKPASAG